MRKLIPSLGVTDINRSLAFYREHLGFESVQEFREDETLWWTHLRSGGAELMLQQLTEDQLNDLPLRDRPSWVMYVAPDDIDAMHTRLQDNGVDVSAIESTSYGTRECYVIDPDGYELWVSSPAA